MSVKNKRLGLLAGLRLPPVALKSAIKKQHYKLAVLVARCDLNAAEPADMADWHAMQPVGREVLDI